MGNKFFIDFKLIEMLCTNSRSNSTAPTPSKDDSHAYQEDVRLC